MTDSGAGWQHGSERERVWKDRIVVGCGVAITIGFLALVAWFWFGSCP